MDHSFPDTNTGPQGSDNVALLPLNQHPTSDRTLATSQSQASSSDDAHEKETKLRRRRIADGFQRAWKAEILAWLASLMIFAAIAGILAAYNRQPPPQLSWGITLNALVSLLATLAMMLLAFPVSSCLGQLKWLRLSQTRELYELYALDQASRSAWGSLKLILTLRGGPLASLGAALTIIMLAIGPFLQQIVSYSQITETISNDYGHDFLATAATVAAVKIAAPSEVGSAETRVVAAFYQAIFSSQPTLYSGPAICATSKCTWSPYTTMALCSKCLNQTDEVVFSDRFVEDVNTTNTTTRTYSMSDGTSIRLSSGTYGSYGLNTTVQSSTKSQMLNLSMLAAINKPEEPNARTYTAWTCSLQPCWKTLNATFVNGSMLEKEISPPVMTEVALPSSLEPVPLFPWLASTLQTSYIYNGDGSAMVDGLNGSSNAHTALGAVGDELLSVILGSELTGYNSTDSPPLPFYIPDLFANIASSLTYGLRAREIPSNVPIDPAVGSIDAQNWILSPLNPNATVYGTCYTYPTLVQVTWGWISLPLGVEAVVLLFLVLVKSSSDRYKMAKWGDSNLATIFHGFNDRADMIREGEEIDMKAASKKLQVKMIRDEEGARLLVV